jgi:hypothetical protein
MQKDPREQKHAVETLDAPALERVVGGASVLYAAPLGAAALTAALFQAIKLVNLSSLVAHKISL